jgi:prepilin-type N-terminal cleavage/methylation domain-containing protein
MLRTGANAPPAARTGRGFTLIEIMAVVLIIGLVMALVLPGLGATSRRNLLRQARELAAYLELARQRAVTTGVSHRVLLDLEQGGYFVEWYVNEDGALGPPARGGEPEFDLDDTGPLSLAPPADESFDYRPIPIRSGGERWLDDGFFFEGVETAEGWFESGLVAVVFDSDGTADAAQIVISDPDSQSVDLDVAPLLETVRIRVEE